MEAVLGVISSLSGLFLVLSVVLGPITCSALARTKGRSEALALLAGFFGGPYAVAYYVGVPVAPPTSKIATSKLGGESGPEMVNRLKTKYGIEGPESQ